MDHCSCNEYQVSEQIAYPSLVLHMVRVAVGSSVPGGAALRSSLAAGRACRGHARHGHTRAVRLSSPSNVKQHEFHKMCCTVSQKRSRFKTNSHH